MTRGPGFASSLALSPDGRMLVIAGTGRDGQRLYQRRLDRLEVTPLPGTERGANPFFSWDGAWVGFSADGRLKRVPASGGAAVDIVDLPGFAAGACWGPDDRIVFASGPAWPLHSVHAKGGSPEPITGVSAGYHPDVLPDGHTLLFESGGWIHLLERVSGRQTRLVQGMTPRYVLGHLIFSRGATLLAAALDVSRHELRGPVIPLAEAVAFEASTVGAPHHFAVSRNATLAYVPAADAFELALVDTHGDRVVMERQPVIENPRFSPDGRRAVVAVTRRDGERTDLWVQDLQSDGLATRLTFDGGRSPVWMPDGDTVAYAHHGAESGIYARRADGQGEPQQLLSLDAFHWLVGWTPTGRSAAYGRMEGSQSSIVAFSGGQSQTVVPAGSIWGGRLSKDGQWLAYYSLESGTFEVYVTPFPSGGPRWLIAEGSDPAWGPDATEVYYRSGSRLMAARIDRSAGVRVVSHRLVIEPFLPPLYDDYDVHPDGRTLLIVRPAGATWTREVPIVVTWSTELHRLTGNPDR